MRLFLLPIAVLFAAPSPLPALSLQEAATFDSHAAREHAPGPHVPEPMVFDLVRPLEARKGEIEANTLAVIPFKKRRTGSARAADELGLVPLSRDEAELEWAPEIEIALWDGFAIEFEFPFEGSRLEELKLAVQGTFGTAFEHRFIHGFQGIAERALESTTTTWTGLYLAALRLSPRWSLLGMWGVSHETGAGIGDKGGDRTQLLQNLSIFCALGPWSHIGLETNYARSTQGAATLLLMPQVQVDFGPHFSVQFGAGAGFSKSETLPQAAVRVVLAY